MKIARHLRIEGRVQGVGYRYEMQKKARQLGLTGWVRNRHDGTVEAMICSDNLQGLDTLIAWAWQGPRLSNVTQVAVSESEPLSVEDFVILSNA